MWRGGKQRRVNGQGGAVVNTQRKSRRADTKKAGSYDTGQQSALLGGGDFCERNVLCTTRPTMTDTMSNPAKAGEKKARLNEGVNEWMNEWVIKRDDDLINHNN